MRGLIRYLPNEDATYIIGFIDWYVLSFWAAVAVFWDAKIAGNLLLIGMGGLLLLGSIYRTQAHRFRNVAEAVPSYRCSKHRSP